MKPSTVPVSPKGPLAVQLTTASTCSSKVAEGCPCLVAAKEGSWAEAGRQAGRRPGARWHRPPHPLWHPPALPRTLQQSSAGALLKVKTAWVVKRAPPGMSGVGVLVSWIEPSGRKARRCCSDTRIASVPSMRVIMAGASMRVLKWMVRSLPSQSRTMAAAGRWERARRRAGGRAGGREAAVG